MATTPTNAINCSSSSGLVTFNGTASFSTQALQANSLMYGTASNTFTNLGVATNGQLIIGSTGAAPVLATLTEGSGITITNGAGTITISATGGSAVETFTYISTQTASSTTNLDFTGIDSTYNRYRILLSNLVTSTSAVFAQLKLSTDGNSTFTNCSVAWIGMLNTTSSSAAVVDASNSVATSTINLAKNGSGPIVGTIDIYMPASSSVQTMVEALCTSTQNTSAPTSYQLKAQDETRQTINAFRIAASTGNFTSGTAILYGVS